MRSFLTMLGIIIGVASVIVLVALVDGFKQQLVDQFESMGTNLISVSIPGRGGNRGVTPDDVMEFSIENAEVIGYVSPVVNVSNLTVKNGAESVTTTAMGTNEFYPEIKGLEVEYGRFLEYVDVERRQKSCVIGTYIANELYQNAQSALGSELKINGISYTIVGVLEEVQDSEEGSGDDIVYLPYTLATGLSWNGRISSYAFSAAEKELVEEAENRIRAFLYSVFNDSNAYRILNQSAILEVVNDLTGTITMILVGIAAISLLVGGIGIMNIMLVSVTERTREIGIRKSLGATPWDIMSQFVVEAATTSSFGGFLGIALGIGAAIFAGNLMGVPAKPSFGAVAIAFSVSVGIGMIFGYFPAKKASRMNPIEALRYD
ncbi:MAG: ABC transporter permease [Clostridia bacterium]|nr:ABC transporter permease [Clostridia bacterium]